MRKDSRSGREWSSEFQYVLCPFGRKSGQGECPRDYFLLLDQAEVRYGRISCFSFWDWRKDFRSGRAQQRKETNIQFGRRICGQGYNRVCVWQSSTTMDVRILVLTKSQFYPWSVPIRPNPPFTGQNGVEKHLLRQKPRYTGRKDIKTSSSKSLWQPMCHRKRILASPCQGEAKKVSLWQATLNRVHSTPSALPKWIGGRSRPEAIFTASKTEITLPRTMFCRRSVNFKFYCV